MTNDQKKYLLATINSEGFDYAFLHYSNFEEVKDSQFHKLRRAYVKSAKRLKDYIEKCSTETHEDD